MIPQLTSQEKISGFKTAFDRPEFIWSYLRGDL